MSTLTSGLAPAALTRANAPLWTGRDYPATDYILTLDDAQVAEVAAITGAASRLWTGRDMTYDRAITAADFPLPILGPTLRVAAADVSDGHGFTVLRGLPIDGLNEHETAVMVRGLVAHFAPIATQSRDGQLIRHVRATRNSLGDTVTRGHQTAERLWFHTDGADAAVLLCRQPGASGGLSRLACAAAVHNAILDIDPQLAAELYQPFHFHMAGGNTPGLPVTFISPIFSLHNGQFSTRYVRHTLLETPNVTGVPLPDRALAAFDLIEAAADELSLDMRLQAGDLQIVNNHTVLHSRTRYTDPDDPALARHLLRCWLTFPGYRGRRPGPVDEALRHGWLTDDVQEQAALTWTPPAAATDD
jgi:hypothetical protein